MKLETTSFGNAVQRLREGLARDQRDANTASLVVAAIPAFLEEAERLYAELQRRLG